MTTNIRRTNISRFMKMSMRWMVCGALGAGLASCAGEQGSRVITPEQQAAQVPVAMETWNRLGYQLQWRTFASMGPGGKVRHFTPMGTMLFCQDSTSVVSVFDAASGERRWTDQVHSPLIQSLGGVRYDKKLVVASEADVFFFDIETGTMTDKQHLVEVATTSPILYQDVLVLGTTSNAILGHHLSSGFRKWSGRMSTSADVGLVKVGSEGVVGCVSRSGDVMFIRADSGATIGRNKMFAGTDVPMAASEGAMFVASRDQSLYGFASEGGTQLWRVRTEAPLRFAPAYAEGMVYCDLGVDGLSAVESTTGKIKWHNKSVHGAVCAMNKSRVMVFDGQNVTIVDAKDGSVIDRAEFENISMIVTDKIMGGDVYAVSGNGVIAKLTPKP